MRFTGSGPEGTTADQPDTWTVLEFEANENDAPKIAEAFAGALNERGWYVDFRSPTETFVVFADRIFHYARGDEASRAEALAEAQAHGRSVGVPEAQLDWPVRNPGKWLDDVRQNWVLSWSISCTRSWS